MRLAFTGTIDESAVLLALATSDSPVDILVDCTGSQSCDAATLDQLLALRDAVVRRGRFFCLAGVPDALRWRFELVGLIDPPARSHIRESPTYVAAQP